MIITRPSAGGSSTPSVGGGDWIMPSETFNFIVLILMIILTLIIFILFINLMFGNSPNPSQPNVNSSIFNPSWLTFKRLQLLLMFSTLIMCWGAAFGYFNGLILVYPKGTLFGGYEPLEHLKAYLVFVGKFQQAMTERS